MQTQVCSLFLSRFQSPWPEPFMDFPIRMPYQKPCSVFVLFRKERDPCLGQHITKACSLAFGLQYQGNWASRTW